MTTAEDEARRVLAEYARRDETIGREFYALAKTPNLFALQGQQRALLDALMKVGALPLSSKRILDIGCGLGQWFTFFEDFGAQRERIAGNDLNPARIAEARTRFPGTDLRVGDAAALQWADGTFDLVLQATVFTSILDERVRRQVASEMLRVLAPHGAILWYDFRYNNPRNRQVRGVPAHEISQLFTGCTIELAPVTLAPPLARALVPRSWFLATALEQLRLANTHYFGVIRRR